MIVAYLYILMPVLIVFLLLSVVLFFVLYKLPFKKRAIISLVFFLLLIIGFIVYVGFFLNDTAGPEAVIIDMNKF